MKYTSILKIAKYMLVCYLGIFFYSLSLFSFSTRSLFSIGSELLNAISVLFVMVYLILQIDFVFRRTVSMLINIKSYINPKVLKAFVLCISLFLIYNYVLYFTSSVSHDFYLQYIVILVVICHSFIKLVLFDCLFKKRQRFLLEIGISITLSSVIIFLNFQQKKILYLGDSSKNNCVTIIKYPFNRKCYLVPGHYSYLKYPDNNYLQIDNRCLNIYIKDSTIQIFAYPDWIKGDSNLSKGINKLIDTCRFKYHEYSEELDTINDEIIRTKEAACINTYKFTWFDVPANCAVKYKTRKAFYDSRNLIMP